MKIPNLLNKGDWIDLIFEILSRRAALCSISKISKPPAYLRTYLTLKALKADDCLSGTVE